MTTKKSIKKHVDLEVFFLLVKMFFRRCDVGLLPMPPTSPYMELVGAFCQKAEKSGNHLLRVG